MNALLHSIALCLKTKRNQDHISYLSSVCLGLYRWWHNIFYSPGRSPPAPMQAAPNSVQQPKFQPNAPRIVIRSYCCYQCRRLTDSRSIVFWALNFRYDVVARVCSLPFDDCSLRVEQYCTYRMPREVSDCAMLRDASYTLEFHHVLTCATLLYFSIGCAMCIMHNQIQEKSTLYQNEVGTLLCSRGFNFDSPPRTW